MSAQLPLSRRVPVTREFLSALTETLEPDEQYMVTEGEIGQALVLYTRYGKRLMFYSQRPVEEPEKKP